MVAGVNAVSDFRNFRNLKELQLLMGMMTNDNLMDIYGFFRLCKCPRLEKLYIEVGISKFFCRLDWAFLFNVTLTYISYSFRPLCMILLWRNTL